MITTQNQNRINNFFDYKNTAGVKTEVKPKSFSFINACRNTFNFNYPDNSNIAETLENSLFREHSNNRIAKYFYSNQPRKTCNLKKKLRKISNNFDKKIFFRKKRSKKNNLLNIKLILSLKLASGYSYDGLGSVRNLTAENGQVTDAYTYYAFGEILSKIGNTENRFLFTGEQYDPNVGFYYLRARLYNPSIGRFWTMDTYEGDPYSPASLNKYAYGHNNSVNNIDPSGHGVYFWICAVSVTLIGILFQKFARKSTKYIATPFYVGLNPELGGHSWVEERDASNSVYWSIGFWPQTPMVIPALISFGMLYSPDNYASIGSSRSNDDPKFSRLWTVHQDQTESEIRLALHSAAQTWSRKIWLLYGENCRDFVNYIIEKAKLFKKKS